MKFPSEENLNKMFKDLETNKVEEARRITCLNATNNWSRRTGGKRPLVSAYYNGQKRYLLDSEGLQEASKLIGFECCISWLCGSLSSARTWSDAGTPITFYSHVYGGKFNPFGE